MAIPYLRSDIQFHRLQAIVLIVAYPTSLQAIALQPLRRNGHGHGHGKFNMELQSLLQSGIKYAPPIAILALLYQNLFHGVIFYALGVGRTTQAIEEFPYTCRRIVHPLLEACEDMQIDSVGRTLYAACSTMSNRGEWSPALVLLQTPPSHVVGYYHTCYIILIHNSPSERTSTTAPLETAWITCRS